MKKSVWALGITVAVVALLGCTHDKGTGNEMNEPPDDMELATALWARLVEENYATSSAAWTEFPGKDGRYPPDTSLFGNDPHRGPVLFRTFVTTLAASSLQGEDFPLPDRSVLVKENYKVDGSDTTLADITVMEKRAGYNPDAGDWFWVQYAPGGEVEAAGKIQGCISCHSPAASRDYVWTRVE